MKLHRIKISSWTASFRYPNIISGFQPTLEVPPISTVLGLLNAAAGKYLHLKNEEIGFYFYYQAKAVDLETIYQMESHHTYEYRLNIGKKNILKREFLYDCTIILYLTNPEYCLLFKKPVYPLLLGRSCDLAGITEIEEIDAPVIDSANKIKGQVIPFFNNHLPGQIQPLPVYFTDTNPRQNLGTQAYSIIPYHYPDFPTRLTAIADTLDNGEVVHIYLHRIVY